MSEKPAPSIVDSADRAAERRKHEEGLSYRHRALFDGSKIVMLLIDADTGKIVDANPAASRYYGYSHAEITNLEITDINTLDKADVEKEMARARAAEQGYFEFQHRLADGSVHDVHVYSGPVRLEGRDMLFSIVHDVTEQHATEDELELRSAALAAAANGIVITDAEGTIVWANEAVERMTGYPPEELIGRNPRVLKSGRQPESYYERLWETITAGEVWEGELENKRKDGSLYIEEMKISPVPDRTGTITHFIAIKEDVTSERRALDALAESEERFRLLAENALDVVFRFRILPTLGFEYVSPSAEEITGYTPEEHYENPRLGFELVHPDDRALLEQMTTITEPATLTARWVRKDGSILWTEQHVKPILDEAGDVVAIEGIARDVTERVEHEQRRELLEAMVETAREGIVIVRPLPWKNHRPFVYANQSALELLGYAEGELSRLEPEDLLPSREDPMAFERAVEAIATNEGMRVELDLSSKGGREIRVELRASPILDAAGGIRSYAVSVWDVTMVREQEARLSRFRALQARLNDLAERARDGPLDHGFFQLVLHAAVDAIPHAEAGTILLEDDQGDFAMHAVKGFGMEVLETGLPRGVALEGVDGNDPVALRGYRPDALPPATREILFGPAGRSYEIRSSLKVPIWTDDSVRALLCVDNFERPDAFDDDDAIEMGRLFGSQIGSILQRIDLEGVVKRQATTDALTGMPNRDTIERVLAERVDRAVEGGPGGVLVLADVDGLGLVNDAYGHTVGDELLRGVGRRLRDVVGPEPDIGRWSGDEFMIVARLSDLDGDASGIANAITDAFHAPLRALEHSILTNVTLGIMVFPKHARDHREAIQRAHIALNQAKENDQNAYAIYSSDMGSLVSRRIELARALTEAIGAEAIEVHYQPRIELRSDRLTAVEALARWTHPEFGAIPPDEFIAIAEETGSIHALGDRVLNQACAQARAWLDGGTPRIVAVNLSLKQFQDADLVARLETALRTHGLPPDWLELEITESVAMTDAERTIAILQRIRRLGIRLSIDDFGTAYSSLAHLHLLPIDALKIDKSFVRNLAPDPADSPREASIVQAIVTLGKGMNLKVIAEGVETPHQRAFLQLQGCHEAQGYLWGRPVPAAELDARLGGGGPVREQGRTD